MKKEVTTHSAVMPKISIITPTLNQADLIPFTIDSVLGQGYPNMEYIIIDGGSTDGTVEILKKYHDLVKWISEKDKGQSDAINKGLKIASGDILAFLNSDDIYESGALEKVGKFFAEHPQAKWVTGKCYIIDRLGRRIRPLITFYKNIWLYLHVSRALFVLNYISQPATFWRKEITKQIGYFNESLFYTLDYEYWLNMEKVSKLYFLNSYLASFRCYADSKSGSTTCAQFEEQLRVARRSTSSAVLLKLQEFHNFITVQCYKHMATSAGKMKS
ncbi:MAG TPA: glycosyltransferase family 2 protein [Anaerolineales bacterium]|jgi:glycosyltransferase involved in cell wall biosynthesis